jgi:alcohol dehydrogenase class IV
MSYKITTITGIAHGHAVSILLPEVLDYMIENINFIQDIRGIKYVENTFDELCEIFDANSQNNLVERIKNIINDFDLTIPVVTKESIDLFTQSVNSTRLKNNPIIIDRKGIQSIYIKVFDNKIVN